jgi:hypothetical protein
MLAGNGSTRSKARVAGLDAVGSKCTRKLPYPPRGRLRPVPTARQGNSPSKPTSGTYGARAGPRPTRPPRLTKASRRPLTLPDVKPRNRRQRAPGLGPARPSGGFRCQPNSGGPRTGFTKPRDKIKPDTSQPQVVAISALCGGDHRQTWSLMLPAATARGAPATWVRSKLSRRL